MDSSSKIHQHMSFDDDVMLASLDNLSLNEVLTNEALCLQKGIATEVFHPNLQPDIIAQKTSKTKPSVNMLNELASQTKDCALTILDDSCCPNTNGNLFLNSTYVVPDDMASSLGESINTKIDFVPRRNSHSNSHQQPNSSDCVITLYESSESDTSINDSESSYSETSLLHSESSDRLDCKNENLLSYIIRGTSLASEDESTEEYSCDSEDSSDSHGDSDDSRDISNESEDSSDSDSVSSNDDSDEEPNPSNDEESEDSDEDSSTTSEDKPDSDDESERDSEDGSDESDDSSDDDRSVDLDEASESSSESSEDSD